MVSKKSPWRSAGARSQEYWLCTDPFKARYPNKPQPGQNVTEAYRKRLQHLYENFNDYDRNGRRPMRYQFMLNNKMICVSATSKQPKLYGPNKQSKQHKGQ